MGTVTPKQSRQGICSIVIVLRPFYQDEANPGATEALPFLPPVAELRGFAPIGMLEYWNYGIMGFERMG
jgi:hypothetical protein